MAFRASIHDLYREMDKKVTCGLNLAEADGQKRLVITKGWQVKMLEDQPQFYIMI